MVVSTKQIIMSVTEKEHIDCLFDKDIIKVTIDFASALQAKSKFIIYYTNNNKTNQH